MTTVEHAGFLAAIIEEPHDDFHRIVYADWLEENGGEKGNERAKDIRWGVERGNIPVGDLTATLAIRRDCPELFQVFVPNGGLITEFLKWRRGFIAEIHGLTFDLWKEHGPRLVRQHPLEVVKLAGDRVYQGHAEEWFTCMLPEWFLHFYNAKATPYRRTREEAEKYLSDVLIWWAKAQELPQGEE